MESTSPINTDSEAMQTKVSKLPPPEFNIRDIVTDLIEHVMKTDYEHLLDRITAKHEIIDGPIQTLEKSLSNIGV